MTTPVRQDFVELSEDVSASPLWNPDLAPTPLARRTWSTYHIAALWIGMSVVITTYTLASGLMQQGMTWWQAMITILLGNSIVLLPMVLNAHAGTKYGVSFPVLCRASFGVRGANVPATLRALVACGWFGIQTWIGGLALHALLLAAWPGWSAVPGNVWIAFALFWLVQVAIIIRGLEGIKKLEGWSAPLLLGGGALLLAWAASRGGGLGRILDESQRLQTGNAPFWQLFPAGLTANVGYWATLSLNIPDFTRYARSQRSQALGQALGGVDVVFHQAAIRITQCAEEPRLAMEVLADGTFNVLEAAVGAGVGKVVAASSASVYGLAEAFPTGERHHLYNNRTLYGAAKAFNEGLLRSFHEMYGLRYVALRYFNVYGPRMDIHGVYTEVLIRWMERIAAGQAPLILGDGSQTMDFVYIEDVARANLAAARADVGDEVFNVASGVETSLNDLAKALLRVMGSDLQPEYGPERSVNPVGRRLADTGAARRRLGFEAVVGLEEGLAKLVAWWQAERREGRP